MLIEVRVTTYDPLPRGTATPITSTSSGIYTLVNVAPLSAAKVHLNYSASTEQLRVITSIGQTFLTTDGVMIASVLQFYIKYDTV